MVKVTPPAAADARDARECVSPLTRGSEVTGCCGDESASGGGGNALVYHFTHPAPTTLRIKSKSEFDYEGGEWERFTSAAWCFAGADTTSRASSNSTRLARVFNSTLNSLSFVLRLTDENICDISF